MVFLNQRCCITQSFNHLKHTFKGLLRLQIMRFFRIFSNEKDVDKAWGILFQDLCK